MNDNFAGGSYIDGNGYCSSLGKKYLIAERQVKLSKYLDAAKSQMYLADAYTQEMSCDVPFKNFDEKSELVSGTDPDLFVNVEFNAVCCG